VEAAFSVASSLARFKRCFILAKRSILHFSVVLDVNGHFG